MNHQYYNVLGIMSGTSLDGIDIAHITLVRKERWSFVIHKAITVPYSSEMKQQLAMAIAYNKREVETLNIKYTRYLAEKTLNFIDAHKIDNLVAVCSHGHTIFHQPQENYTLQIGNLPELAQLINQRVVCDYRVQDVAM
ncbi:MAG: anhydro-N-acetylmuramic acid kinase, partial [Nonlabens sp.]